MCSVESSEVYCESLHFRTAAVSFSVTIHILSCNTSTLRAGVCMIVATRRLSTPVENTGFPSPRSIPGSMTITDQQPDLLLTLTIIHPWVSISIFACISNLCCRHAACQQKVHERLPAQSSLAPGDRDWTLATGCGSAGGHPHGCMYLNPVSLTIKRPVGPIWLTIHPKYYPDPSQICHHLTLKMNNANESRLK
jgi:hypothetical protein